jgi:hypothetical protein
MTIGGRERREIVAITPSPPTTMRDSDRRYSGGTTSDHDLLRESCVGDV